MTNKEKFEALKAFLTENNVKYIESYKSGTGVVMDLKIPDYGIAVHIGDDDGFYKKVYKVYNPFFIRESESVDFVIEKMQNCLTKIMMDRQARYMQEQKKAEGRRINEENMKRHEAKLAAKKKAERKPRKRIVRYEKV